MAITAENLSEKYSIPRSQVDEYSLNSHLKAAAAAKAGHFASPFSVSHFMKINLFQAKSLQSNLKNLN